jgi:hypothetical protein
MTLSAALTQHPPAVNGQPLTDAKIPVDLPAPFFDIVRGCLVWDPVQRLTVAEIGARIDAKLPSAQTPAALSQPTPQRPSPSNQQPQPAPRRPAAPDKPGPPKSLFAPMLIAVLAVTGLLAAGLGLLWRHLDAANSTSSTQPPSKRPEAISSPNRGAAASREKPSPGVGQRQTTATLTNTSSTNPAPTLSLPAARADVVLKVFPEVPQRARDSIQGTIRVGIKVHVDSFGNVVGSELDLPGPSKYFARLATEAAQDWKFAPSNRDADRDFLLRFEFTNTETRAWIQAP